MHTAHAGLFVGDKVGQTDRPDVSEQQKFLLTTCQTDKLAFTVLAFSTSIFTPAGVAADISVCRYISRQKKFVRLILLTLLPSVL